MLGLHHSKLGVFFKALQSDIFPDLIGSVIVETTVFVRAEKPEMQFYRYYMFFVWPVQH